MKAYIEDGCSNTIFYMCMLESYLKCIANNIKREKRIIIILTVHRYLDSSKSNSSSL